MSFKELDGRIRQMSMPDILAINRLSEYGQMQSKSRALNVMYLIMGGFILFTAMTDSTIGSTRDYIQISIASIMVAISIAGLIRGGKFGFMAVAGTSGLIGIYNLVLSPVVTGQLEKTNLLFGAINVLFALVYIQEANRYSDYDQQSISDDIQNLHRDIVSELESATPSASNALIELHEIAQKITIWLRPGGVVIFMHREKRLFVDSSASFHLSINGKDSGGDKVPVRAQLIDKTRQCSISRHHWLRYVRFAG